MSTYPLKHTIIYSPLSLAFSFPKKKKMGEGRKEGRRETGRKREGDTEKERERKRREGGRRRKKEGGREREGKKRGKKPLLVLKPS